MKFDLLHSIPYPRDAAYIQVGTKLAKRPAATTIEELLAQEAAWCAKYPEPRDIDQDKRYEMVMAKQRGLK